MRRRCLILFCGVALAISAVPVMARIVDDTALNAMVGARHAMSAAMLTDALGWMLLAAIASLSSGPRLAFARMFLSLLAYLVLCALTVRFVVRPTLMRLASTAHAARDRLAVLLCFVMASALATSLIGFHSAFGALAAALFVRRVPGIANEWRDNVEGFVRLVLMPVFFAYVGCMRRSVRSTTRHHGCGSAYSSRADSSASSAAVIWARVPPGLSHAMRCWWVR